MSHSLLNFVSSVQYSIGASNTLFVTVLAKGDQFMVKQTYENSAKITTYRKVHKICLNLYDKFKIISHV